MTDASKAVVAGVGMTRFGKYSDRPMRSLAEEAVHDALSDAGVAPKDIEIVFFSNATAGLITGQEVIRGQVALAKPESWASRFSTSRTHALPHRRHSASRTCRSSVACTTSRSRSAPKDDL